MCKHRIFKRACIILTTIFFFLLLKANLGAAEDKADLISNEIYSEDCSFKSLFNEDEAGKNGFVDGEYLFDLKEEYFADLFSSDQTLQDESATISSKNSVNSQPQDIDLSSAHKYLGYGTAALAGITAVSSSSGDFHKIAGYATAGLSLITTAIGFYEYGEYIDLDEGFTGYNMHMILETLATAGFIATAALQSDKNTHAVIGGVSTAMMILPIFVVHW
jgi:hypothetical protein